jgi:hypothetical protein
MIAGGVRPGGGLAGQPGPPRPVGRGAGGSGAGGRAAGGGAAGGGCEAGHGGPPAAAEGGSLTAHGGPPADGDQGSTTGWASSISHGGLLGGGQAGFDPGEGGRPDIAGIRASSPRPVTKTHYVQLDHRL